MIGEKTMLLKLADIVKSKPYEYWAETSSLLNSGSGEREGQSPKKLLKAIEIDNEDEANKLQRSLRETVKNFLKKHCNTLDETTKSSLNNKVTCEVTGSYINDYDTRKLEYKAFVHCPMCNRLIHLTRVKVPGKTSRWITSNYQRLLEEHLPSFDSLKTSVKSVSCNFLN